MRRRCRVSEAEAWVANELARQQMFRLDPRVRQPSAPPARRRQLRRDAAGIEPAIQ